MDHTRYDGDGGRQLIRKYRQIETDAEATVRTAEKSLAAARAFALTAREAVQRVERLAADARAIEEPPQLATGGQPAAARQVEQQQLTVDLYL